MDWKEKLDSKTRKHVEAHLRATFGSRDAIINSKDKKTAQLWVAIANLSEEILKLNMKIKFLEMVLKESIGKKNKKEEAKKIIDNLYKF